MEHKFADPETIMALANKPFYALYAVMAGNVNIYRNSTKYRLKLTRKN
jgi:hypothetical protein